MRAKLKVATITRNEYGEDLVMTAVCKPGGYPQSGADEDNTFSKFTPTAELRISIRNPELIGSFNPGDMFYVDFTPVTKQ